MKQSNALREEAYAPGSQNSSDGPKHQIEINDKVLNTSDKRLFPNIFNKELSAIM